MSSETPKSSHDSKSSERQTSPKGLVDYSTSSDSPISGSATSKPSTFDSPISGSTVPKSTTSESPVHESSVPNPNFESSASESPVPDSTPNHAGGDRFAVHKNRYHQRRPFRRVVPSRIPKNVYSNFFNPNQDFDNQKKLVSS